MDFFPNLWPVPRPQSSSLALAARRWRLVSKTTRMKAPKAVMGTAHPGHELCKYLNMTSARNGALGERRYRHQLWCTRSWKRPRRISSPLSRCSCCYTRHEALISEVNPSGPPHLHRLQIIRAPTCTGRYLSFSRVLERIASWTHGSSLIPARSQYVL